MSTEKATGRVGGHTRESGYVPSAEAVEAGARARHEDLNGDGSWDRASENIRQRMRVGMSAALSAAVPVEVARLVVEVRALAEPFVGQWHPSSEPKTFDQGVGALAQDLLAVLDTVGVPAQVDEHDPRCISLGDTENNVYCDCKILRMIDDHMAAQVDECTGAGDCGVSVHEHGCFADRGNCNDPDDHAQADEAATGGES